MHAASEVTVFRWVAADGARSLLETKSTRWEGNCAGGSAGACPCEHGGIGAEPLLENNQTEQDFVIVLLS